MRVPLILVALAGCKVKFDSGEEDTSGDDGGGCPMIGETTWTLEHALCDDGCSAALDYSASGCTFTLTGWTSAEELPDGGAMDGYDVTLSGSTYWETCTGEVEGTYLMSGTCADDGESWTLTGD